MKPSIPQGTRDFSAPTIRKRIFIFDTIKNVFELYGLEPLETPAMENLDTLLGKYGDEGDKLIFRILDSGEPFDEAFFQSLLKYMEDFGKEVARNQKLNGQEVPGFRENPGALNAKDFIISFASDLKNNKAVEKKFIPNLKNEITEKALRYDLTIPLARYVAMNHHKLTFPFRRYQMQPVWRADRPQKGRYREFYQCDADIVGSYSLINDVELAAIYAEVFKRLKIGVEIKINSRKLLRGIMEVCEVEADEKSIIIIIDKTDKIGIDGVIKELRNQNISPEKLGKLIEVYSYEGNNNEKIEFLRKYLANSQQGLESISDIEFVLDFLSQSDLQPQIDLDLTLARGLAYYTGIIYEVRSKDVKIGSIGGGGRYDNLTGLFGVPDIPGVGISFGVDRIYDVMEELKVFPEDIYAGITALFINMGEEESKLSFKYIQQLRSNGISCELYHETAKIDKQFKYAVKKNIPFVIIIGSREKALQSCVVKHLTTGEQNTIPLDTLKEYFKDRSGLQIKEWAH